MHETRPLTTEELSRLHDRGSTQPLTPVLALLTPLLAYITNKLISAQLDLTWSDPTPLMASAAISALFMGFAALSFALNKRRWLKIAERAVVTRREATLGLIDGRYLAIDDEGQCYQIEAPHQLQPPGRYQIEAIEAASIALSATPLQPEGTLSDEALEDTWALNGEDLASCRLGQASKARRREAHIELFMITVFLPACFIAAYLYLGQSGAIALVLAALGALAPSIYWFSYGRSQMTRPVERLIGRVELVRRPTSGERHAPKYDCFVIDEAKPDERRECVLNALIHPRPDQRYRLYMQGRHIIAFEPA
jgi:hypothetical protein